MAENSLYSTWTWECDLPEPFGKLEKARKIKRISYQGRDCSRHNKRTQGKLSRLHPATLSAILRLIQIRRGEADGACGIQKRDEVNYFLMEYEKPEGRCVLVYNRKNGRFTGQRTDGEQKERLLCVVKGKSTGEEFLAMLAYASMIPDGTLYDEEFADSFAVLESQYKIGWKEQGAFLQAAFLCSDNLYRRMTAPPDEAIPLELTQLYMEGKMDFLSNFKMALGVYEPNDQIWGTFEYLAAQKSGVHGNTISDMKKLYSGVFRAAEQSRARIPELPETYRVSEDAEEILQRVVETPARMFMLTGSAGGGKTTDAKIIAQVLGLPYYVFTCGPDTDELTLLASTVPNMGGVKMAVPEFPHFEDMMMDPASALSMVNGVYQEGITQEEAFGKLLMEIYRSGYERAKAEKDFLLKESEIIKACREPCVLEIQEPSAIEKPGALVRLNSLFDDGACTDLLNGEMVVRNPDTIVIMTTNLNYAGCHAFNESVISRMALVQHREDLSPEAMIQRIVERTGFNDEEILPFMASTVQKIREHLEREDLQGGTCGYRELENWVWSYKTTGNLLKSVKNTVISKAAFLQEDRQVLMDTYILPHLSA